MFGEGYNIMDTKKTDKREEVPSETKETLPDEITIHYLKMKNYRTYHVDGIFGGVTPSGDIYIEPFVQRPVTPRTVAYGITENGTIGDEIPDKRTGKAGIIREVESGLVMNIEVAKVLRDWIDRKIVEYEKFIK